MTPTKPELTKEELRVKVAEAMGYSFLDEGWRYPDDEMWQRYKAVYRESSLIGLCIPGWVPVPDYPNDLNACAELRATLTEEERERYAVELAKQTVEWVKSTDGADLRNCALWLRSAFPVLDATALQHCLAFLATKETK